MTKLRLLVLFPVLFLVVSCASGPSNLIGLNALEPTRVVSEGATIQNLFIATSRRRSDDASEFFSGEREQALNLANVDVSVPNSHVPGKLEQRRFGEPEDISKHFTIAKPSVFANSPDFVTKLNSSLSAKAPGDREVLVFVHGYNTNFTSAVLRVSQFVKDTGFNGVPLLFTWASRGRALDYVYDINSALQARFYLLELAEILAGTNAESFSIVAHSMGNLVTLEAMTQLIKQGFRSKAELNRVILAAPDVDLDLFDQYASDLAPVSKNIVVLVSKDDRALKLSRRIAGGVDRVGAADPDTIAEYGLDVIDLTQIDDDSNIHHTKFAQSPEIVKLIGRGIADGNTLSATTTDGLENSIGSVFRGFRQVASGVGTVVTLGN
ncbi:MAG: alpha/beta hydrolase [Lentilitoribacter sp.]